MSDDVLSDEQVEALTREVALTPRSVPAAEFCRIVERAVVSALAARSGVDVEGLARSAEFSICDLTETMDHGSTGVVLVLPDDAPIEALIAEAIRLALATAVASPAAATRVPDDTDLDALVASMQTDATCDEWRYTAIEAITNLRRRAVVQGLGIAAVTALINESHGVYGLHLNGDTETWENLQTGGRFEEWLRDFDAAAKANTDD